MTLEEKIKWVDQHFAENYPDCILEDLIGKPLKQATEEDIEKIKNARLAMARDGMEWETILKVEKEMTVEAEIIAPETQLPT